MPRSARIERVGYDRHLNQIQGALADRQGELESLEQTIDRRREEAAQLHESERRARREMRRALYIRDIHLARLALDDERISRLFLLLERHRPPPGEEDLRGFEWRYLWGRCHQAKRVLRGHPELVSRVVFTPDGKCLLAAGHEGTLEMWDADSGEPRGLPWQERGRILSLVFAPEGRTLITGGKDGKVRLRDWPSGRERAVFSAHPKAVYSVGISPDGQTLATGGEEGRVKLWDRKSLKCELVIPDYHQAVTRTVFSPDGKQLATVSTDHTGRVWDIANRRRRALLRDDSGAWVADVAFSPDGKELAVVSMQPFSFTPHHTGSVQLADISTSDVKITRKLAVPGGGAFSVAYTADGQTLVWGSNTGNVVLWDRATTQVRDTLHGHTARIHTLAFSPDGRTLASGGNDKTVRLWDLPPRMELALRKAHNQPFRPIAVTPDGKRFAVADEKGVVSLRSTANPRRKAPCRDRAARSRR